MANATQATASRAKAAGAKASKTKRPRRPMLAAATAAGGPQAQFYNEAVYALASSQPGTRGDGTRPPRTWTIAQILAEALRVDPEVNCTHVEHPKPPTVLYGKGARDLMGNLGSESPDVRPKQRSLEIALRQLVKYPGRRNANNPDYVKWRDDRMAWATEKYGWIGAHAVQAHSVENAKLSSRHGKLTIVRQARNVATLLSAVASFPGPPDPTNREYVRWRDLVVAMAKEHYGEENILSIVEHMDEPGHGHIHILVARSDARPIKYLHAGHGAVLRAKGRTAASKLGRVYRVGGKLLQRKFWKMVGKPCGLVRKFPTSFQRESRADVRARARLKPEIAAFKQGNAHRIEEAIEPLREHLGAQMADDLLARLRRQFELAAEDDDGVHYVNEPAPAKPPAAKAPLASVVLTKAPAPPAQAQPVAALPLAAKESVPAPPGFPPARAAPAKTPSLPPASPAKLVLRDVFGFASQPGLPASRPKAPPAAPSQSEALPTKTSGTTGIARTLGYGSGKGLPAPRISAAAALAAKASTKAPLTEAQKRAAHIAKLNATTAKSRAKLLDRVLEGSTKKNEPDLE